MDRGVVEESLRERVGEAGALSCFHHTTEDVLPFDRRVQRGRRMRAEMMSCAARAVDPCQERCLTRPALREPRDPQGCIKGKDHATAAFEVPVMQ